VLEAAEETGGRRDGCQRGARVGKTRRETADTDFNAEIAEIAEFSFEVLRVLGALRV
jgi:hypothetical protein